MITRLLEGLERRRQRRHSDEPRRDSGALTIEYSPHPNGQPDPGEVVWMWVPYEDDPSQGKDRPVVVIGRSGERLATVALTSKAGGQNDERLAVGTGPWDPQQRPSYAKLERILIVDPADVRREGAMFDRKRFDQLIAVIRRTRPVTVEVGSSGATR